MAKNSNAVEIGAISDAIAKELAGYSLEVAAQIKAETDIAAKELLADIKKDAPAKTGKYRKNLAVKVVSETPFEKKWIWYAKDKYGNQTSWLENGHLTRNGRRTRAFPHIRKNADAAAERLESRYRKVLENGKK